MTDAVRYAPQFLSSLVTIGIPRRAGNVPGCRYRIAFNNSLLPAG